MTFEATLVLLGKAVDDPLACQCLAAMKHGKVLFHTGFEGDKEYLADLYRFRLKMTRDLGLSDHIEQELQNWEVAVDCLDKHTGTKVHLHSMWCDGCHYLLFSDPISDRLISSFVRRGHATFEEQCDQYDQHIARGLKVSAIAFDSGRRVRDWAKNG